jgi:hypothetical protein
MGFWQYRRVIFDAAQAECLIYTFKEGLLSAVAHDLILRVTRFTVEVDAAGGIDARFDPASLKVVGAVVSGRLAPNALSERDRVSIEENIVNDVLEPRRAPEIRFVAPAATRIASGFRADGRLALHGRERPVTVAIAGEGETLIARARLHQPDFGIKPYRALLGTLRIQPDVEVRLTVPRRLVDAIVASGPPTQEGQRAKRGSDE